MTKIKCIKTFSKEVEIYLCGRRYNVSATVQVYRADHNILGIKWHSYDIKRWIPYNNSPYYDGEFASNKLLEMAETELCAQASEWIANNCD